MRDKIDDEILEEVSEEVEMQEKNLTEKLHRANVRWPWLKIVAAIVLVVVALSVVAIVQHGAGQETGETVETENGQTEPETGMGPEEGKLEDGKTGEKTEEEKQPEPKPEAPKPVTVPQNTGRKLVALTFDDGPSASTTGRLLDILAAKKVKVTFFVLGNMAQRSPALIQREVAEGHEVESHTMSHQNLVKLSGAAIQDEIAGADAVLKSVTGSPAKLVRPPYGSVNATVRANVGKPMIIWTVDPEDWKYRNAATVRANVVSRTFDGAIVLMHDIHSTTVDAVGAIIDDLRAAGYEFLTVSELAAERGVVLQNGASYGSFRP